MFELFYHLPFLQADPVSAAILATLAAGSSLFEQSKASSARSESERQNDLARQAQEVVQIGGDFLSQLIPGSEEYNEMVAEIIRLRRESPGPGDEQSAIAEIGQQLVARQQQRIAEGGPATPLESRTNLAFDTLRKVSAFTPEEQDVFNALRGEAPGTPAGEIYTQLVERARIPDEFFTQQMSSALDAEAERIADVTGQRFARRGLIGSGLELEQLGRAGVDLALREAAQREEFRQQQLHNLNFLTQQAQNLRGREIGLEEKFTDLQRNRERELTDLLAGRAARGEAARRDFEAGRTGQAQDAFEQARALEEQRRQEAMETAFQVGQELSGINQGFQTGQAANLGADSLARPDDLVNVDALLKEARAGNLDEAGRRDLSSRLTRIGGRRNQPVTFLT